MVFSDVCGWYVCIVFGMILKIYIAVSCKKKKTVLQLACTKNVIY